MNFHFKPFHEMTPDDYAGIGLACGLEVHQQLRTGRKLFCHCPVGRFSDQYDAEVLRHMRPTLSELGEYDGTALMEKKTRKNIFYRIHRDTACTYDIDDTPPFFPDPVAIDIALELSMLLGLNIVGEMHIARKQYLDGSIPAGFQRTAILGVSGWFPYMDRRIGVRQLSLEEDSCREVSDEGHDRIYLTDRVGMPLIEVVTEPDMRTPQEAAEVCHVIRLMCRATGKVRTGYGAARQDVNVSVRGGTRVEIKGVPQITRIPLLIYNEARRQCSLLHIRDILQERGVSRDTFRFKAMDVTRCLSKVRYPPLRTAVGHGHRVQCVVLHGFAGLLNHPTQADTTFAKEFADRVRVVACLTDLPNIVHSDTAAELLVARDWKDIRRRTGAKDSDALILVWGGAQDTATACDEIALRAEEATQGIPSDTRQALADGTNGFERVLPGAERMYPDTDLPPIVIEEDRLRRIRSLLSEPAWARQQRYRELALPADVVDALAVSPRAPLFDRLVSELGVCPVFAAVVLVQWCKALNRNRLNTELIDDEELFALFAAYAQGRIAREGVPKIIHRIVFRRGGTEDAVPSLLQDAIAELAALCPDAEQLKTLMSETMREADGLSFRSADSRHRFVMGRLMHRWRGAVNGKDVAQRVEQSRDREGAEEKGRTHDGEKRIGDRRSRSEPGAQATGPLSRGV